MTIRNLLVALCLTAGLVLAFLLYSSEMPSGPTALPADRAKLAQITFERRGL